MGYTSGSAVPLTPGCSDVESMPKFCRTTQIIELPALGEIRYTSEYTFVSAKGSKPPSVRFVFGPSTIKDQKNVIIDGIESVSEYGGSQKSDTPENKVSK